MFAVTIYPVKGTGDEWALVLIPPDPNWLIVRVLKRWKGAKHESD